MPIVNKNLKFLRVQQGMTQKQLAEKLGLKQAAIGAYEEERATPPLASLLDIMKIFNVNLDDLVKYDLSRISEKERKGMGSGKREVLAITVDSNNKENVELVSHKASAGYLSGYQDTEFVKDLPRSACPYCQKIKPIGHLKYRATRCCRFSRGVSFLASMWKILGH